MSGAARHTAESAPRRAPGVARALAWMGIGAAGCLALLTGAALLVLPALEQRPEMVAGWIGSQLGREVTLREFELAWSDGAPLVRLRALRLGPAGPGALALDTAEVRIDTMASLRAGSLRPQAVTLRGTHIRIDRRPDGALEVAGLGSDRAVRAHALIGGVLAALPGGARLGLEGARVTLAGFGQGGPSQPPVVFEPVSMHLRGEATGLRLSGAIASTHSPGTPLRFSMRWADRDADPFAAADVTLSARDLPLAALLRVTLPATAALPLDGRLSVDLDGSLHAGRLQQMRGTLQLDHPGFPTAPQVLGIDSVQSLVEFARPAGGNWRLTLLRLQTHSGTRLSLPSNVTLSREDVGGVVHHRIGVDHVAIATVRALLPHMGLDAEMAARVPAMIRPEGRVEDLVVDLGPDLTAPQARSVSATLREVRAGGADTGVAVGPADMRVSMIGSSGQMDLLPSKVQVLGGNGTKKPGFSASGSLRWHLDAGALALDTSELALADGTAIMRLDGSVRIPPAGGPVEINAQLSGSGVDAATMHRYLALGLLTPKLTGWLAGAVTGGRATGVNARLRGTFATLDDLIGGLSLDATFEDVTLRYLPAWPELAGLRGRARLDAQRFSLDVDTGQVSGARVLDARAAIENVTAPKPVLVMNGRVNGRTEHGAAFLEHSPLAGRFAGLIAQLDARGQAGLDLTLRIPLSEQPTTLSGVMRLHENNVRVPALRSALTEVNGEFTFDSNGLGRGKLQAVYLEQRISARMERSSDTKDQTRLVIDGDTDTQGLLRHLLDVGAVNSDRPQALPLLSRLSGRAHWQVLLEIPHQQRIADEGIALTVSSDLVGMALDLPAPLGKSASQSRALRVITRLAIQGPREFVLDYGDDTHALLEMAPTAQGETEFRRGTLRFGDTPLELPPEGLVVAGRVPLVSIDDWVSLIAQTSAAATGTRQPMEHVRAVAIRAARLVALGAGFDDVRLGAERDGRGPWRISVQGADVDGEIRVPMPVGSAMIDATFERLRVRPASATGPVRMRDASGLAPRDLPAARLVIKHLHYNEVDLGLAKLTLSHAAQGLEMRELFALSDHFELRGSGHWSGSGIDARSALDLRMHSNDFGSLTKALGYGESGVQGGAADVTLHTEWDGSPFDFALERVRGDLGFRATGGRLLEVDPGTTGRVFGLLNVTVLPRRLLRLDFSDLFQEGVRYELIEGAFRLDAGNAYAENVSMHMDTARVDLDGRVGLVAEDYDQIMTVTPKLSASLPLAPLWLAEQFLNRKLIDHAFAYRYIITGSWAEPKVERERIEITPNDPR